MKSFAVISLAFLLLAFGCLSQGSALPEGFPSVFVEPDARVKDYSIGESSYGGYYTLIYKTNRDLDSVRKDYENWFKSKDCRKGMMSVRTSNAFNLYYTCEDGRYGVSGRKKGGAVEVILVINK